MANAFYAADGTTVLQLLDNASDGAQLASGVYAVVQFNGTVTVYNTAQVVLASLTGGDEVKIAAGTSVFTVLSRVSPTPPIAWNAYRVTAAGTVSLAREPAAGLPVADTDEPRAFGTSPDGSLIYYAGLIGAGTFRERIYTYNMTTGAPVGTFITKLNFDGETIVVRANGDVLVSWVDFGTPANSVTIRYNSAGVLQSTYTVGEVHSIALDPDGTTFWVRLLDTGTMERRLISTGATLDSITDELGCPQWFVNNTNLGQAGTVTYPIRRQRRAAHLSQEQLRTFFSKLQIDIEPGVGLSTGQGSDPMMMLRWSDDGAHTWSSEVWVSAGKIGEYSRRAIWRRLGSGRDRVFEVTMTDPVKWVLLAGYLDAEVGTS